MLRVRCGTQGFACQLLVVGIVAKSGQLSVGIVAKSGQLLVAKSGQLLVVGMSTVGGDS